MNSNSSVLARPTVVTGGTLVFIDLAVPDALKLMEGVIPGTSVYPLSAEEDAVVRITEMLMQHRPVSSVHIVSHGRSGRLHVGNQWLSLDNLQDYADELQSWSYALAADAEILLYGCEVGQGDRGWQFVQQLGQLTGAKVAAAAGLVGSAALGGTWNLGVQTDRVMTELVFQPEVMADYAGVLADAPTVSLTALDTTAAESGNDTGTYRIDRGSDITGDLIVKLSLSGSADFNPNDHTLSGGSISITDNIATIVIPAGQSFVDLTLTAIDDIQAEAAESLSLGLVSDSAYILGSSTIGVVTIAQNDFVVTNTNDSGEGSLRQAILNANALAGADTITFAGTGFTDVTPDTIALTTGELVLTDTTTILGLGANQLTVSGNNISRVFTVNSGVTVTLNDLTIANGYADNGGGIFSNGNLTLNNSILANNRSTGDGGGLYNTIGNLTINTTTFSNNSAQANSGGFQSDAGTVTITSSNFTGNSSSGAGGGFYVSSGTVNLTANNFTNNTATYGGGFTVGNWSGLAVTTTVNNSTFTNNSAGYGGAIDSDSGSWSVSNSTLIINNSTFTGNTASQYMGGISSRGTLEVNNSTLSNNTAGINGGGIYSDFGTVTVNNSTLSNNTAGSNGGGIWTTNTNLTLSNTTLDGNVGNNAGGGIWTSAGSTTVNTSTLSNNSTAINGGGGIVNYGSLVVNSSTLSGNSALANVGGGIYNAGVTTVRSSTLSSNAASVGGGLYNDGGTFTIGNSIVAGNLATTSAEAYGSLSSQGYNLVGQNGSTGGFTTVGTDIVLAGEIGTAIQALANNGGPTQTHALTAGSIAINAGNNALVPVGATTDQRGAGFDRILGGHVDIGAVESATFSLSGSGGNKTFVIRSNTTTITDFGGVGKGANPSTATIAAADTLQFSGPGLTAQNLLLTQDEANLKITFEGVINSEVILQNFQLENLDNITKANGANVNLVNILFEGQTSPQDSFDVFDATSTQGNLWNRNSVTFLNDLNNNVRGFNNSDDVINGQGGNDTLYGLSGSDRLRGGTGNDILIGGRDNDVLVGGLGADYFSFGASGDVQQFSALGRDTIADFNSLEGDRIILGKGTFRLLTPAGSTLVASDFATVTSDLAAGSSSARIVYNSSNGNLFYNSNGSASGFGVGGQFAQLSNQPTLSANAFLAQV